MEDILKRSEQNQDQMSSRVTALLAGSSLTTTAGVRIERRDTVDQIDYTAVGKSHFLVAGHSQWHLKQPVFSTIYTFYILWIFPNYELSQPLSSV